ncbi:hypothetical protein [Niallia sp. FSL R7-0271]
MRVVRDITFNSWIQVFVDVIMIIGAVMFAISVTLTILRRLRERKNNKVG